MYVGNNTWSNIYKQIVFLGAKQISSPSVRYGIQAAKRQLLLIIISNVRPDIWKGDKLFMKKFQIRKLIY